MIEVHGVCHPKNRGQQAGADGQAIQLISPASIIPTPVPAAEQAHHLRLLRSEGQCTVRGQPEDCLLADHMVLLAIHDVADIVKERSDTQQPMFELAQSQDAPQLAGKGLHPQGMTGSVVCERDQACAGQLQNEDRRAQSGDVLLGIVPIRGQKRMPELGRQRPPALDSADDGLYLAVGQGANASFFKQDSQRLLNLSRIEAGELGQSGNIGRPVTGQAEKDLRCGSGKLKSSRRLISPLTCAGGSMLHRTTTTPFMARREIRTASQ